MNRPNYVRNLLAIVLAILLHNGLSAQMINVWQGGEPGHETDWNYSKNWSRNKTPDVFDIAIIPNVSTSTRHYPVISSGEVEVLGLEIQQEATLTLKKSAHILMETFICNGTCVGCSSRILIENADSPQTVQR